MLIENKIIKFAVCFTESSRKWNAYETLIISIIIRCAQEKSLFCKQIYDDSRNVRNFLISQRRENLNQTEEENIRRDEKNSFFH